MGRDPPAGAGAPGLVELHLAGPFWVARDGRRLSDAELGSRKARTLLKLLAVSRPGALPADQIVELLWPRNPPADPGQNVAVLVSRLRRALGTGVIDGDRAAYRLGTGPGVRVDIDEAAALASRAERELESAPAVALTTAQRAASLLSPGAALADEPYATWADPARDELQLLLRRSRHTMAAAHLLTGDAGAAARVAAEAMAADRFDEVACRQYMSACAAAGEDARALQAYALLRAALAEDLGTDPAAETRDLHLAILQQRSRTASGRSGPAGAGRRAGEPPPARRAPAGARRPAVPGTQIVGRERELAELTAAWERAAAGTPSLALIVGEAGIGKTRLAQVLAGSLESAGATVLQARCYETERSLFLQPVVEAVLPAVARTPAAVLHGLLGEDAATFAALIPEAAAILGPLPTGHLPARLERRRAFHSMGVFLRELAAQGTVLLLLDDLQYAGQSTVEFLHYLARHSGTARLLVVATLRAESDEQAGAALADVASRIELGPLSPVAVAELARQAGQAGHTERIISQTRGHALFVVEMLRALADGDEGLPGSLRDAVLARARRCGPAVEEVLRAAAVLGASVDPGLVAAVLDITPANALRACELAGQARLLVPAGHAFEFANDLIREALYAGTGQPARAAYHRRAADLLTHQPEALAYHAAAAGDWARAARGWLSAAETAFRRFAISDAAALASEAIVAAEQTGDFEVAARARVLRGRAHEAATEYQAALDDFGEGRSAARAAGDARQEMLALRHLGGDVPVNLGFPVGDCEEPLAQGLQLAGLLGDREAEAELLTRLAVIASHRLRFDLALDYGQRAAAAGRSASDARALAAGLDGLKTALGCLGRTAELGALLGELEPLVRKLGDPFLLPWTVFESCYVPMAAGDWDRAAALMRAAIEVNQQAGYPDWAAFYLAHLGWLARLRGSDDEAAETGRRALEISEVRSHPWWHPAACAMLGGTLLALGERAAAVPLLESGAAAAGQPGAEAGLLRCLAPLAEATGSAQVLARARSLLATVRLPAGEAWLLGCDAYLSLSRACLAAGEPARARAVLAGLLGALAHRPWAPAQAAALITDGQAMALLGDRDRGQESLSRGMALARRHGLAGVLRQPGQTSSAR